MSDFNGFAKRSDDIRALAVAMAKAQGEIKPAKKNKENTHFKVDYADLAAIAEACRPALSKVGVWWTQTPRYTPEEIWLETMLIHGESGQFTVGHFPIPNLFRNDSQKLGAAFTYARRFSLAMMVGVVAEDDDDDGNSVPAEDKDGMNQDREPPKPTKAQSAGIQWAAGALRRIPLLDTPEKLVAWETERQDALTDLSRIVPDEHKKVMAAIAAQAEKLDASTSG